MVSQLEDVYKSHFDLKQQKKADTERKVAGRNIMRVFVPLAFLVTLTLVVLTRLKGNRRLAEQREETERLMGDERKRHEEDLETERHTHSMEQASLSGRLRESNRELKRLKEEASRIIDFPKDGKCTDAIATALIREFRDEPVCRIILERTQKERFKSSIPFRVYKGSALDKQELLALRCAADRHYNQFTVRLKRQYPKLSEQDLDYCCLYLLGLRDSDVFALMQRSFNTVAERRGKLMKILGGEKAISDTMLAFAEQRDINGVKLI